MQVKARDGPLERARPAYASRSSAIRNARSRSASSDGGNAPTSAFPILAGQTFRYLYLQLRDFQEGRRSDPQMSPMVAGLSRDELRELADYFAAQKPKPQSFKADPAKFLKKLEAAAKAPKAK